MKNVRHLHNGGFTLIELMIVVVVMALLAAIAYPNYIEHVRKARRADAKTALMNATQRLEVFFSRNATYSGASLASTTSPEGYYTLSLSNLGSNTYTVTATPAGDQSNDSIAGFRIDQSGKEERLKGGNWVTGWED